MTFDEYFIILAREVAKKSKDTTKVGCVIVGEDNQILTTGWNGFSRGVEETPERMSREHKADWTIHAEANAICNAARSGVRLKNSKAYITHQPCAKCADFLIQAGIECVVVDGNASSFYDPKIYNFEITDQKFREAGITVETILDDNSDN